MNREEEVDHGCSQEGKEIEIEKEGQESCTEKEESSAALQSEAQVRGKEESGAEEEIRSQEEGRGEEAGSAESASSCARRAGTIAEPDHLSPVQPAGGRRQSG